MPDDPTQAEHFGQGPTGQVGTPGIASNTPQFGSWGDIWDNIIHPWSALARRSAALGAMAGGQPPNSPISREIQSQAAAAPFNAPVEAAKHAVGLEANPWMKSNPGTIGIWVLLAALLLLAVWSVLHSKK